MTNSALNPALDKLHDYYQPAPPSWAPQTTGWYVLFSIITLLMIWLAIHLLRRWLANRYRREALKELRIARPEQLSALLKRTALAAWPREKVASLSGDAWLQFLSTMARCDLSSKAVISHIEEIAICPAAISEEDERTIRAFAAEWIRRHRVQA